MAESVNILVIGTGMYSCGRGTEGYGTVMPAVFEWSRKNAVGKIFVAGTSRKSCAIARDKIRGLGRKTGIKMTPRYFPDSRAVDDKAYLKAIRAMPAGPACAIIAVPDHLHGEIAEDVIRAGLHTLVVKPLAPTGKEVRKLIALESAAKVYCAVEFHKRLDEANLMLRDAISGGRIGDPLYFVVEYSQRKSIPSKRFAKWVETTNIFQYLGIHYVDLIYFATNAKPLRAMAVGQKNWLSSRGLNTYDSIEAMVEWKMPSGVKFISTILTNWIDPESTSAMSDQKIKVIGTKGRFESDQKRRGITIVTDGNGVEEPNPYFCGAYGASGEAEYSGYGIKSIHRFLDDVVDIETGRVRLKELEANRPTFRQSLVPTAVLEAVNRSLKRKGEWIGIKDI